MNTLAGGARQQQALHPRKAAAVLAALCLIAIALTVQSLSQVAPAARWWQILHGNYSDVVRGLIFMQVSLPRIAVSCLVGASLGWAGLLFQQALRNPLADPATIGVSSGAYLALAAASLYAPGMMLAGSEVVALGGGAAACALVLAVAYRSRYAPVTVILAGLIVSLFCGAAAAALTLFNQEYLNGLFIWHSGSLAQNGWDRTLYLLPRFCVLSLCAVLLLRPLALLSLEDAHAASLGVNVARLRLAAMAVGVAFSAVSVSAVGVIGFIGLMAPNLAGMLGARTLAQRMLLAPVLGGVLLWLTDQAVQNIDVLPASMPTGSASALVGAPMLLWLLLRHKRGFAAPPEIRHAPRLQRRLGSGAILALFAVILACGIAAALGVGRDMQGWTWFGDSPRTIMDWRAPRVAAAGVAGGMLAMAGTLLQRLTGNPLASPEVLGVSSGASLGIIAALLLSTHLTQPDMLASSVAGALATLLAVVALNWRTGFSPQRLLLAGVALSTLFSACAAFLLTSGDPRAAAMLTWMSGSTYRVSAAAIAPGGAVLVLGYLAALGGTRWLAILPLGAEAARGLGVNVTLARFYFLLVIAAMTASATILVGPLSFVGLLGPHIVTGLGLSKPRAQLGGSILAGASIMILADWVGRTIAFPWQVPAGLVAMLLGGPAFLWFLWRSQ